MGVADPPRTANRHFFLRNAIETRPNLVRDTFPTDIERTDLRKRAVRERSGDRDIQI